jgi:hypothetical protein
MTMTGRRNLAPLGGLLLGIAAVISYFGLVIQQNPGLAFLVDFPFVSLALAAGGIVLSGLGVWRAFRPVERYRGRLLASILAVLNLAVTGFLVGFLFVGSYVLPASEGAPTVGTAAPELQLADDRGQTVRLSDLRGRNVVLVFYRGFW